LLLKLTNKRNYEDFLTHKTTFKQFKKRVYVHCAEERGEKLNYTVLDDLKGIIEE
jgi:hypothetical protein